MEVAEHCYIKLLDRQVDEQAIATSHLNITKQIYNEEKNTTFPKAEERLVGVIGAYRAQEKQKITNVYQREDLRRPKDLNGWKEAMANRTAMLQAPPTYREPSGSSSGRPSTYKRKRSDSRNPRRAPQQRRRERSRTPDRRRSRPATYQQRGRRHPSPAKPDSPGNVALVEALRALLK